MKIIPFWTRQLEDFQHGLDSILMDSVDTPEMDAFLGETDAISSSDFSACLVLFLMPLHHS